jgi:CRP-like cAMP-binding protein
MEDKIWYLKEINIFKSLSEKDLMSLGAQCAMMKYEKGNLVYINGAEPNIYFIKSGSVKVVSQSEDGSELLHEVIEAGEIFGKFIGTEGDEQVVSVDECLVCYMPFDRWQNFIKNHAALSLSFIKWTGLRIRRMERKMDSLYFKTSRQRIVEQLDDIIKRFGKKDLEGNVTISLSLTHEEIAQLTGTSRQNVNTFLNELRTNSFIEYDRNTLIIKPGYFENTKST